MQYFPLAWPFLAILFVIFLFALGILEFQVLTYAYARLGISPRYVLAILLLSLFGSYINIPVAQLRPERVVQHSLVDYFGILYVVPSVTRWPGTVIAVNLGGAVVPTILSLYLIFKNRIVVQSIIAIAAVALLVHTLAKPVRGIGISVPIFVPPLAAAAVAMLLAYRKSPALAYIAGSMGTLIGADLMNLGRIQGLGAPVASIGGAGTFDGIFLTGIIAVLLPPVGLVRPKPPREEPPPPLI
ncbi:MAG TPA: DUF1614 domain-containing protein [Tepidisphaeraceae bacterium]|jgi:uncharacterized membrane protein|nr:DUF1614 domain-containing protein [Tepidisphaeraceae bacterium]